MGGTDCFLTSAPFALSDPHLFNPNQKCTAETVQSTHIRKQGTRHPLWENLISSYLGHRGLRYTVSLNYFGKNFDSKHCLETQHQQPLEMVTAGQCPQHLPGKQNRTQPSRSFNETVVNAVRAFQRMNGRWQQVSTEILHQCFRAGVISAARSELSSRKCFAYCIALPRLCTK